MIPSFHRLTENDPLVKSRQHCSRSVVQGCQRSSGTPRPPLYSYWPGSLWWCPRWYRGRPAWGISQRFQGKLPESSPCIYLYWVLCSSSHLPRGDQGLGRHVKDENVGFWIMCSKFSPTHFVPQDNRQMRGILSFDNEHTGNQSDDLQHFRWVQTSTVYASLLFFKDTKSWRLHLSFSLRTKHVSLSQPHFARLPKQETEWHSTSLTGGWHTNWNVTTLSLDGNPQGKMERELCETLVSMHGGCMFVGCNSRLGGGRLDGNECRGLQTESSYAKKHGLTSGQGSTNKRANCFGASFFHATPRKPCKVQAGQTIQRNKWTHATLKTILLFLEHDEWCFRTIIKCLWSSKMSQQLRIATAWRQRGSVSQHQRTATTTIPDSRWVF